MTRDLLSALKVWWCPVRVIPVTDPQDLTQMKYEYKYLKRVKQWATDEILLKVLKMSNHYNITFKYD